MRSKRAVITAGNCYTPSARTYCQSAITFLDRSRVTGKFDRGKLMRVSIS